MPGRRRFEHGEGATDRLLLQRAAQDRVGQRSAQGEFYAYGHAVRLGRNGTGN
ncbi:hypothetical protein SGGMMB4_02480 [Sodalis glossinidius str. 'morsitans']|uniref:Uncharacterized protein n=1 Tax=Sodalis glossinidius (strain morsitans) TaxID=343509 RepID=A0A193QJA8_SODGM|nr:hypothetical protein SGGMMB4_02480 [Sodalis glossinidius str. 'morsitans']